MAYVGSTAASTVANPPSRIDSGLLSQRSIAESTSNAEGGALWVYNSTNLTTDMTVADFFSDGQRLGMRNGDILLAVTRSTESSTGHILVMGIIGGVSSAGAELSTDGTITSTFA